MSNPAQPEPYDPAAMQPGLYGAPPPAGSPFETGPVAAYAPWSKRVAAYLVDGLVIAVSLIPYYIGLAMVSSAFSTDPVTGDTVVTSSATTTAGWAVAVVGLITSLVVFVWNICLRQGRTGYSIGKGVIGIKLIGESSGAPIGPWLSFVRYLAHILDALPCYLGYFWPLWDAKRQTFADKVMSTVVLDQPR